MGPVRPGDQFAALEPAQIVQSDLGLAKLVEDALGVPAKGLAGQGQADAPAHAVKQGRPQLLFELLDLLRQGRLLIPYGSDFPGCPGQVKGTVSYQRANGPAGVQQPGLPHQGAPVVIGRFRFEVP